MSKSYIGTRYIRPDSIEKVTGATQYTDDLIVNRNDMLIAKVKRIPCSHARIISVNTKAAKEVPGIVAVITAKDIPEAGKYGYVVHDKQVIAREEVICDCDPLAFVAAETKEAAEKAVSLIEVKYEPLPVIDDPRISSQPGAASIHKDHPVSGDSNISNNVLVERGNVDEALADSSVIVENDFRTPMVEHACMETDVAIAEPNHMNGGLTFYSPIHEVHKMRNGLYKALNMNISKIRAVSLAVGGGFGGKEDSSLDCAVVAGILALKTQRPVIYEMTREEVFRYTSKRHRSYIHYKIGASRDGKILGLSAEGLFDKGAYKSVDVIPHRSATLAGGVYKIPAASVHNFSSFTNHVYGGAFRGLGAPQQYFAIECTIDDLALQLGMDPIEFRLKNLLKDGDYTIFGQNMRESMGLGMEECLLKVRDQMQWDTPLCNNDPVIKRGRGVACYMYAPGTSFVTDNAHAYMELNRDGSINVNIAQSELGQGMISAMSLIAAEMIGITPDMVNIGVSDTLNSPESGPTSASRTTVFQGNAIINGCSILKERLLKVGCVMLNEPVEELNIKDNVLFATNYPEKCVPLNEVIKKTMVMHIPLAVVGSWYPPMVYPDPTNKSQTTRWTTFAFGAHGVEVEVDTKTGIIKIVRSVHAIDLGKAINPDTAEGQIDGASAQAFGWGLMEEEFLRNGRLSNVSFHDYLIPTSLDLPKLESIIVEAGNTMGPYGAKGIGEPTILGGAPALRNAVLNATGLAMYEIPLTPVRVMNALEKMKNAKEEERIPYFKVPLE